MKNSQKYNRSGVALITVLVIIMTLTVVALFTLLVTKTETQASSAFRYNRQTAAAAHAVSNAMLGKFNDMQSNPYETARMFQSLNEGGSMLFFTDDLKASTGLSSKLNDPNVSGQLAGDLSHSFIQMGAFGDLNNIGTAPGMSQTDLYCQYTITMTAVAVAGRGAAAREMADASGSTTKYFTQADLDSRVSARKYETSYNSHYNQCQ